MKTIVLVGPTAVGKTALSLELSDKLNAEIVYADSLVVYKDFNIGTAKPLLAEQKKIPHHLIDIVNPVENFTAFDFCKKANEAISDIHNRGKNVLIVGGTGFYIKALLDGMFNASPSNQAIREELEVELAEKGLEGMYEELKRVDLESAATIHPNDEYRIIRALEVFRLSGKPFSKYKENFIKKRISFTKIGLNIERSKLHNNIELRTQKMLQDGLIDEVSVLTKKYPPTCKPFYSVGYQETVEYLKGHMTVSELEEKIVIRTRQLARKQLTWFRADKEIQWCSPSIEHLYQFC